MTVAAIQNAVQASLDGSVKDQNTGIHGIAFVAVDKNGEILAQHAAGTRTQGGSEPVNNETMFYIASCTKFLVAISCMQLVEQGKIGLDDAQALYKVIPELEKKQVFDFEKGELRDRKGDITLRKLLAHTAGFGYSFFDPRIGMYEQKTGKDLKEWYGDEKVFLDQPLVNDPDTIWEYGINIDYAGLVVERISGLKLGQYVTKNICEPLGLKNITFFPNAEQKKNIMTMLQRKPDGTLTPREHLYKVALECSEADQSKIFNSGGAGSFARPSEYVQVLAAILNDGVGAKTGNRILKKETIDQMWENQIPQFPNFARAGPDAPPPADTTLANPTPEFYPQEGNPPQGWGISMFLTIAPGATGRGANTGWWAGISNQFWWCDREKGVAGMICGQVLPFGDMNVLGQWFACEGAVYAGLN